MERAARWSHGWLVPFGALILTAWMGLASGGSLFSLPVFCSAASWHALPLSASFDLALISQSFGALAFGWAVMVVAMMLPLAIVPLWHVRERSFASRRTRSMLLFVVGFIAVWMMTG